MSHQSQMSMQEQRKMILDGTITVFNEKGLKLTMDDVAKELSISKKTIYNVFNDKEDLFIKMVSYIFDDIKIAEDRILRDLSLTTVQKVKEIMSVIPEGYKNIDFRQLYSLKDKYPKVYEQVVLRLESGWEKTIELINKGIEEKTIRNVNVYLVKLMLESSIEQFFKNDILIKNDITYTDALDQIVDIIINGIENK